MTLTEFLTELSEVGKAKFQISEELGFIRSHHGDCPVVFLARRKLHRPFHNHLAFKAAEELHLDLSAADAIIAAADNRGLNRTTRAMLLKVLKLKEPTDDQP